MCRRWVSKEVRIHRHAFSPWNTWNAFFFLVTGKSFRLSAIVAGFISVSLTVGPLHLVLRSLSPEGLRASLRSSPRTRPPLLHLASLPVIPSFLAFLPDPPTVTHQLFLLRFCLPRPGPGRSLGKANDHWRCFLPRGARSRFGLGRKDCLLPSEGLLPPPIPIACRNFVSHNCPFLAETAKGSTYNFSQGPPCVISVFKRKYREDVMFLPKGIYLLLTIYMKRTTLPRSLQDRLQILQSQIRAPGHPSYSSIFLLITVSWITAQVCSCCQSPGVYHSCWRRCKDAFSVPTWARSTASRQELEDGQFRWTVSLTEKGKIPTTAGCRTDRPCASWMWQWRTAILLLKSMSLLDP